MGQTSNLSSSKWFQGEAEISLEPKTKIAFVQSNLHATEAHLDMTCSGPPHKQCWLRIVGGKRERKTPRLLSGLYFINSVFTSGKFTGTSRPHPLHLTTTNLDNY